MIGINRQTVFARARCMTIPFFDLFVFGVVRVAKRLQVAWINEELHVALMWLLVINRVSRHQQAALHALHAEGVSP